MKKIAYALMPLAALILFGICMVSFFGLIVVLMTSVGFANEVPWRYYQKLNIGVISAILPIVGMILISLISVGLRGKASEGAKPAVVERAINPPMNEVENEEDRLKAAA
jgi:hypothetical protein